MELLLGRKLSIIEELEEYSKEINLNGKQIHFQQRRLFPQYKPNLKNLICIPVLKSLLFEHGELEVPDDLCRVIVSLLKPYPNIMIALTNETTKLTIRYGTKETIFHQNSACALLVAILTQYGLAAIKGPIKALIKLLKKEGPKFIDLKNLSEDADPENVFKEISKVDRVMKTFLKSFISIKWASQISTTLYHLHILLEERWPGFGNEIISALIFVKFVHPVLTNPREHDLISEKNLDIILPSLELFGNLILSVFGDYKPEEVEGQDNYMNFLDVIVTKYSSEWKKQPIPLVNNPKFAPANTTNFIDIATTEDMEYVRIIEHYTAISEVQIWQHLVKKKFTEIAGLFKESCSSVGKKQIEFLESRKTSFSVSMNNFNLISLLCDFFNCAQLCEATQVPSILYIALRSNLLDSIFNVAALQKTSIGNIENQFVKLTSMKNHVIDFPIYDSKLQMLINEMNRLIKSNSYTISVNVTLNNLITSLKELKENKVENSTDEEVAKYKFIFTCFGLQEDIINKLIPDYICDEVSFVTFNIEQTNLKLPIGTKKLIQREVANFKTLSEAQQLSTWKIPCDKFSTEDLCIYLKLLGLEMYVPNIVEHKIDGKTLLTYSAESLKDVGITLIGHRKALHRAIHGNNASNSLALLSVDDE